MKSVRDELRRYVINLKRPRPRKEVFQTGEERVERGANHKTVSVMCQSWGAGDRSEGVRREPLRRVKKYQHLDSIP